ncbi:alpha/beta fold hydrolase [Streptomyces sp. NBC_00562]|uniref:alpha/beta hydrolase n=1 Tax=Streptomyces sp. NBC_00562 TaxID=2975777 RepID=UPI002E81C61C|nr:alpha/beta hydrolase [Streptomyces sp. NBC_00562]WUC22176.1 alpha/beta fold hydrolase [Streptomyces sp. NBC_00562]
MKRLWLYIAACAALIASLTLMDARPSSAAERNESTYSYGSHVRQKLDAYWNPSDSAQPGIVILHGGYWYEDSGWATWSRYFADKGYAVLSVDYRLNFDAAWPAQRTDAISAIDWIKSNAAKFDLDPDRIVVLGSSAGGQIATALATYGSGTDRVKGVVGLSPVASPYRAWSDGNHDDSDAKKRKVRDNATILARCFPDSADTDTSLHASCWDTWKDMVVKNRASGTNDAPMYLIHSAGDFIPVQHSLDLEAAEEVSHDMPADGVTVETVPDSGAHGGALLDTPGMPEKVLSWVAAHT